MNMTEYLTDGGKILCVHEGTQEVMDIMSANIAEGHALIEGYFPEATNIIDFLPVYIGPSEPTIDSYKNPKLQEIKASFEYSLIDPISSYTTTKLSTNITVNARGRDLDNAKEVRDKMEEEAIALMPFKCFDNTYAMLSLADVKILISELRDYGFSLYAKKWALEAQVEAATTKEEIDAINW
jgi:hypothetical protein